MCNREHVGEVGGKAQGKEGLNLNYKIQQFTENKSNTEKKETQIMHGPRKSGLLLPPAHISPLQRNMWKLLLLFFMQLRTSSPQA